MDMDEKNSRIMIPVLIAVGLSGGAALIYEVVWAKVLSLVLGSSVYALSTMLSAFMGGLSLGAFLGGKRADLLRDPIFALAVLELCTGVFGIITLMLIGNIGPLYAYLFLILDLSFSSFSIVQFILCFIVMLLPTTLMGATFPIACKALVTVDGKVGKDTGSVYSVNTVGAIIGSMSAGFLLIPYLGMKGANITAACINIIAALIFLGIAKGWGRPRTVLISLVSVGVLSFAAPRLYAFELTFPMNFYSAEQFKGKGMNPWAFLAGDRSKFVNTLLQVENEYGVVQVFGSKSGGYNVLVNNGKAEGGRGGGDDNNQLLLTYLPLAMFPDAASFLNIGLGTGMTLDAAVDAGVKDIDCVEVNPAIKKAVEGHFFPGIFKYPERPRLITADARNYLSLSTKNYDIISSEPSYPTDDSVAHLFTKEFFTLVKARLTPDGVFCQWIPFHILRTRGSTVMIKTFLEVFPNSYFWNIKGNTSTGAGDILMLGSNSQARPTYDDIKKNVPFEMLKGGDEILQPAITEDQREEIKNNSRIPVNTDNRPIIEFMAVQNMFTPRQ